MLIFDEQWLVAELNRVPQRSRAAFAAACAERLMPAYRRFSEMTERGDPKALAQILERLWQDLQGLTLKGDELEGILDTCTRLIPNEDVGVWVAEQAAAEDCAAAVAYSIRCRQGGEAQDAAWAARRVYEALDNFIIGNESIDTNDLGAEQLVLSHPLMQAELDRQRRDVNELLGGGNDELDLIARIRDRAKVEATVIFG